MTIGICTQAIKKNGDNLGVGKGDHARLKKH
jgi:hypothetical protein